MGRTKKDERHNLGHGFKVMVVETIADIDGNNLEGFLYYQDAEVMVSENDRKYLNKIELYNDFNNRVIPAYISKNDVKIFKYLDDELMHKFTKEYLLKNKDKITYGKIIDVIEVLREDGYKIPDWNDKAQVSNLLDFYKCVDRLSKEFRFHLRDFGFPADRNINNTVDHPVFDKHIKCKNIVFTRYPWTTGYKAIKIVNDFLTMTENDLTANTDMKTFKKLSPGAHTHLEIITKLFNKIHIKTKRAVEELSYTELATEFKMYIKEHKQELLDIWSTKRPKNYGVYSNE